MKQSSEPEVKVYNKYSKNVRMRYPTLKLINKLDRSKKRNTPNAKIFHLLSELEKMLTSQGFKHIDQLKKVEEIES